MSWKRRQRKRERRIRERARFVWTRVTPIDVSVPTFLELWPRRIAWRRVA